MQAKIPPPIVAAAVAVVMKLVSKTAAAVPVVGPWQRPLAALLLVAGIAIAVAGVVRFRHHKTTVDPLHPDKASQLVTDGIFSFTRNPMYLGMLVALLAFAVWLGSATTVLIALMFVPLITALQINEEERAMQTLFGEEFTHYRRRTRRWL